MSPQRSGSTVRPPRGLPISELLAVSDQTDEHGRLLLEESAPERAVIKATRRGIPMKTATCPFEDTPSRYGGMMNVSAYEALRRDTREVLDGFAWLNEHYVAAGASQPGTVQTLTEVSKLGITLPLVCFHRGDEPVAPQRSLPSFVASIFKASRGLFSAAFDMLHEHGPGATTAGEVVSFAEQRGHLRGADSERVCAAPTRLIQRGIAAVLTGEGGNAGASRLGGLVPFELLSRFYLIEKAFSEALDEYGTILEQVMRGAKVSQPEQLFRAVVPVDGKLRSFGALTESFLEFANEAQVDLNVALGRADNPPPLGFQDVLAAL